MSDCQLCPVEKDCGYEYKPCDCTQQRKFKQKPNNDEKWGDVAMRKAEKAIKLCREMD
jgi:hypothetical protein